MGERFRAVGCHVAGSDLHLVALDGPDPSADTMWTVTAVGKLERSADLGATRDAIVGRLRETQPTRLAVLLAENTATPKRIRIALEVLVLLAADELGISAEQLNRRTARTQVGLPLDGKLESRIGLIWPQPIGTRWAQRRFAALAARSVWERHHAAR